MIQAGLVSSGQVKVSALGVGSSDSYVAVGSDELITHWQELLALETTQDAVDTYIIKPWYVHPQYVSSLMATSCAAGACPHALKNIKASIKYLISFFLPIYTVWNSSYIKSMYINDRCVKNGTW